VAPAWRGKSVPISPDTFVIRRDDWASEGEFHHEALGQVITTKY
jgi:hypothetical protein